MALAARVIHGMQRFQAFVGKLGVAMTAWNVGIAERSLDDAQTGAVIERPANEGLVQDIFW